MGSSDSTKLFGGEENASCLETWSGDRQLFALTEINICLRENFFLAFSKVLINVFSESTVDSALGGVIGISGLDRGYSTGDWSLGRESPYSMVCLSKEANSPGALEGLMVKSAYVGSFSFSALIFEALVDLKGSSKPFFLIFVCGRTPFSGSGSSLCSFLTGGSVFFSFACRGGSTRAMCLSLMECLIVASPLVGWDEGEVC